jgi:hypothetical protein
MQQMITELGQNLENTLKLYRADSVQKMTNNLYRPIRNNLVIFLRTNARIKFEISIKNNLRKNYVN